MPPCTYVHGAGNSGSGFLGCNGLTPIDVRLFSAASESAKKVRLLQDVFLSSTRNAGAQVTMFLVNGVMLQGRIAAYDLFCMLLEREGYVQLAYKHAVSTIQPLTPVDLTGDWDGEADNED